MTNQTVTRFAPSPTGHLHIGGARTALFCWAYARRTGGRFMIRIEDTDQARSSEASARGILEDLAWLGIAWDDGPTLATPTGVVGAGSRPVGPYFQAQRLDLYNAYVMDLVRRGRAYPAFETSEELEAKRKAVVAAKQTYRYDRAALQAFPTPEARLAAMREADAAGRPYVVRLLAPAEEVVVRDEVLGEVRYAAGEMDDFVIRKADGFPTYHFAVVVDDELMGVTDVLRAQEHLNNTPRHVALQGALVRLPEHGGPAPFRTPRYAHMPLIFNMDGTKMSKRDKAKAARKAAKDAMAKDMALTASTLAADVGLAEGAVSAFLAAESDAIEVAEALARRFGVALPEIEVWDFRRNGYLPEAITNFIALMGWSPGLKDEQGKDVEKFDSAFLASHFSIDRIGKTNAKFDRAKLLSFNGDAIAKLPEGEFIARLRAWMAEHEPATLASLEGAIPVLAKAIQPRARTFRDAIKAMSYVMLPDDGIAHDAAAVEKNLRADGGRGLLLLREARAGLAAIPTDGAGFDAASVQACLEGLASRHGLANVGPVAQAVRVAITGTAVSPPLGESLAAIGRERSLRRIDRCLAIVGGG